MVDVAEAIALRARKILQLQREAGVEINQGSIRNLIQADAPAFSLATRQEISPGQIEEARL